MKFYDFLPPPLQIPETRRVRRPALQSETGRAGARRSNGVRPVEPPGPSKSDRIRPGRGVAVLNKSECIRVNTSKMETKIRLAEPTQWPPPSPLPFPIRWEREKLFQRWKKRTHPDRPRCCGWCPSTLTHPRSDRGLLPLNGSGAIVIGSCLSG